MIETSVLPEVELTFSSVINYAIQQNRIPLVRKLVILNQSDEELRTLRIVFDSELDLLNRWEHKVDSILPGQSIEVDTRSLNLSSKFLAELTEKIICRITLAIYASNINNLSEEYGNSNQCLYEKHFQIDVLAYDQWNGLNTLPEMLAAFVTPNHPDIVRIIQKASNYLNGWTGNPSFDGYQSRSQDRVRKQMAAIFEAIANIGIVYCTPPASFENEGQRVRTSDLILSQKLGTCLDMALFYASCLEAVGLNPIVILIKGHAFAAAWLTDDSFTNCINDDVSLIKKRTASGINEIALVETTAMNAGQNRSFDDAVKAADSLLINDEDFHMSLDIRRARQTGIKPIPQRINTSEGWQIIETQVPKRDVSNPLDVIIDTPTEIKNNGISKQNLWERKLLDLTLRNNLLNLRITQNSLQLFAINLGTFEDALANGDEFQILPKPDTWQNSQEVNLQPVIKTTDPISDLIEFDIKHRKLRSYLTESELKNALTKMYRSSRLSLEENGANTLYLALGFLKWYETAVSETARYAPILLLPVEIIRKSAATGYIIRSREEDTIVNITLLEMLKQDFGITIKGLDEIPRDDSGVDVKKVFNILRRDLMSQKRWDVEEHCFMGIFSFNKFIMWNDIHKSSTKLIEQKIVKSLITGKLSWNAEDIKPSAGLFDQQLPSDIALPISADSTQLNAIIAAANNKSFILHGPPGTGKSQTITNIIANALYQGKKVLFIAEKMAALSVVQKRLENIGLAPFCMELHSNKAKKSIILDHLNKTTQLVRKTSPLEYESEATRLHNMRAELNEYVTVLHKSYPLCTLHEAVSYYSENSGIIDNLHFENDLIQRLTREAFKESALLIEELQNAGINCGDPGNHPLFKIKTTKHSQQVKSEAFQLINQLLTLLDQKRNTLMEVCGLIGFSNNSTDLRLDYERTSKIEKLCAALCSLPETPTTIIKAERPQQTLGKIIDLALHGEKSNAYWKQLEEEFSKELQKIKTEAILLDWKAAEKKWFLPKFLSQRNILNSLAAFSKSGKIKKNHVVDTLDTLLNYQNESAYIDDESAFMSEQLDFLWKQDSTDWMNVRTICEMNLSINQLLLDIFGDPASVKESKNNLAENLKHGNKDFLQTKGKSLLKLITLKEEQQILENKINDLLVIDFTESEEKEETVTDYWISQAKLWLLNWDALRDWSSWNQVKQKVINAGFLPLVKKYETGEVNNRNAVQSFKKSVYKQYAEYIIESEPALDTFNGKLFEAKIEKFREQSSYFEALAKSELFAKLSSHIPSFTVEASTNSEVGILQRAIRNNGRAMSLRKLFDSTPNLLFRLCPCMLMSPISIAQYFDMDTTQFDLVIFDEASQMPTCEAVGAIARADNMIVVGDPKQMPPTSFFSGNSFDEENADKEDLESILDDCLALSLPSLHLLWHYRSKHESLIAFSNSQYYENKLLTFPSPDDIASKVSNINVPGHYDRGKSRQNSYEASAIIKEVLERLSSPELRKRSIGIVTFSSVQQSLIEDMLTNAFLQNPELEKIAMESAEPLFIKNLENVQGDERDVILFSIGYGPDKDGKIYLNFGPLNKEGGWRRLNVAISRARYEMKVFSTLRSDQIDISRTSSEGVMGLKAFLEYSEKGKSVLAYKESQKVTIQQELEKCIAHEIEKLGYKVHTNIGCSGFRINIGIIHPEKNNEYILGILTDGHNYAMIPTLKDREVVQPSVLQLLGWNILRVWTLDWWYDPKKVVKQIEDAIQSSKSKKQIRPDFNQAYAKQNTITTQEINSTTPLTTRSKAIEYKLCFLESRTLQNSDQFFEYHRINTIHDQIQRVMQCEAPISHSLLSRRVLNAWGIGRLGVRLNDHLSSMYKKLNLKYTEQNGVLFYWNSDQDSADYDIYRINEDESLKRSIVDLPYEEITCALCEVIRSQFSLPRLDLIREAAKLLGYSRMGGNVESCIQQSIDYALKHGLIIEKDEKFILKDHKI